MPHWIKWLVWIMGTLVAVLAITLPVVSNKVNVGANIINCEEGWQFLLEESKTLEVDGAIVGERLVIEVNKCRMTYYRDGTAVKTYIVAVGKRETPSPVGEWRIINKGGSWGGGFGSRWMGLNVPWGIYGIHGTNKPESIGGHTSHGCIRMHNKHVEELYKLVKTGTPVHILGQLPRVTWRNVYRRGQTGQNILQLQFALRAAGFDQGPADARFGPGMERAVRRLELFYGLVEDGVIAEDEQYLLGVR